MTALKKGTIKERYDHLLTTMSSQQFLKMEGLGNEVPFFIFPFPAHEQNAIDKMCNQLVKKLTSEGIHVLNLNLYDLSIELLKKRGVWEQILEEEQEFSKMELKEDLQGVLSPEKNMIPLIAEKIAERPPDILFLTGVGAVFPYIRSHTVLNNLQSTAKDCPTVMWFPGEYVFSAQGGSSLDLFGKLRDDKYYRAFNILEYQN